MVGRTLHLGNKGHLPGERLRTQSRAPMILALIHDVGLFNWRNVGHVLRRPGDLAVQARILCLALLHLTVPPLLCKPILFTKLGETVFDSLPMIGHDTTKWSSVVPMKHTKIVFYTKVQQVIFLIVPQDYLRVLLKSCLGCQHLWSYWSVVLQSILHQLPAVPTTSFLPACSCFMFSAAVFFILLLNIFQRSSSFVSHSL